MFAALEKEMEGVRASLGVRGFSPSAWAALSPVKPRPRWWETPDPVDLSLPPSGVAGATGEVCPECASSSPPSADSAAHPARERAEQPQQPGVGDNNKGGKSGGSGGKQEKARKGESEKPGSGKGEAGKGGKGAKAGPAPGERGEGAGSGAGEGGASVGAEAEALSSSQAARNSSPAARAAARRLCWPPVIPSFDPDHESIVRRSALLEASEAGLLSCKLGPSGFPPFGLDQLASVLGAQDSAAGLKLLDEWASSADSSLVLVGDNLHAKPIWGPHHARKLLEAADLCAGLHLVRCLSLSAFFGDCSMSPAPCLASG